jgi:hypothetical protein
MANVDLRGGAIAIHFFLVVAVAWGPLTRAAQPDAEKRLEALVQSLKDAPPLGRAALAEDVVKQHCQVARGRAGRAVQGGCVFNPVVGVHQRAQGRRL